MSKYWFDFLANLAYNICMRTKFIYFISVLTFILICLFSTAASSSNSNIANMLPASHEKLKKPIRLNDLCKQVKIVEWRSTPGWKKSTTLTPKAITVVDKTCNLVVKRFYSFVISKKYNPKHIIFKASLSFIPADMDRDGAGFRNLNDIKNRFALRSMKYPLWGYYHRVLNWTWVRNDVFNDNLTINIGFIRVLAHELFHALSSNTGVYSQHSGYAPSVQEERLTQEFLLSLGFSPNY
jgi:uncharacterized protein YggT (Ycf19 family)